MRSVRAPSACFACPKSLEAPLSRCCDRRRQHTAYVPASSIELGAGSTDAIGSSAVTRSIVAAITVVAGAGAASTGQRRRRRKFRCVMHARGGQVAMDKKTESAAEISNSDHPEDSRFSELHRQVCMQVRGEIDPEMISGAQTGWDGLDNLYHVVPGELTVVTGTPGSGKSEFLLSMVTNLAKKRDWRIGLYCFEVTHEDLVWQLLEKYNESDLSYPYIEDDAMRKQTEWIDDHFAFLGADFQDLTAECILQQAQAAHDAQRMDAMIIDPYNYIGFPPNTTETIFVSSFLSQLKQFGHRNSCHVFLVAHPTKKRVNGWTDRPTLYDVSGSANFFNKCDMGIVLARNFDKEQPGGLGMLKVHVDKVRNREAGTQGSAAVWFNKHTRSYSDSPLPGMGDFPATSNEESHTNKVKEKAPKQKKAGTKVKA